MSSEIPKATSWFKVRHRYNIYIEEVMVTKESLAYVWVAWSSTDISKGYPGTRCKKIADDVNFFKKFEDAQRFAFQVVDDRRESLNKKLEELLEQEKALLKFCEERTQ